ncbi:MAG: EF-hand domain-containing protein [Cyclobacteriaceae bacterium]
MLSPVQEKKQRLYFKLLDFDRNGFIEKNDFQSIAENLCIIQGIELDTIAFREIEEAGEKLWMDIREYVDTNRDDKCSFEEWMAFADEQIVNSDEAWYDNYINSVVNGLFDLFDANNDGLISDMEYLDLFISFRIEVRFAARCFRKLDLNNDGYISRDELVTAVREFLRSDDPEAPGNWLFGNWEDA